MAKITIDLVCTLIKDADGKIIDIEFDNGSRFKDDVFHGLEFNVVKEEGPAGGWPEVELTGHEVDIGLWLGNYYVDPGEELDELISQIEI
jgi:hypothetical protein